MKTYTAKPDDITHTWWLIDAEGQTLGRIAASIANLLRGKHKPTFTPHIDTGDFVVVVNAEKIGFTGKKGEQKIYYQHSGYPGGLKKTSLNKLLAEKPEQVLERAVRGMLPHNKLGRQQFTKLKVYTGPNHPHEAQKPVAFTQQPV